jgi:uncharacterized membrane protein
VDAALSSPANNPENGAEHRVADPSKAQLKCRRCGAALALDAAYCPDCKWPLTPLTAAERAAAAAAYLPLLPAAVFLFLPAFRRNRFVRFHAWQSLTLWTVFFVLIGATILVSNVASPMAVLLFGLLTSLAMLFLWIVLSLKAWQGERLELPLVGELATRMR